MPEIGKTAAGGCPRAAAWANEALSETGDAEGMEALLLLLARLGASDRGDAAALSVS